MLLLAVLWSAVGAVPSNVTLVAPGTKWCGLGSTAADYDDLGHFRETDRCCRDHDFCPEYTDPGQTYMNLTNYKPFPQLECSCDERFYACLKLNADAYSDLIGWFYFDSMPRDCFRNAHPARCARFDLLRCVRYEYDETQPKRYQWFNTRRYICSS